MAPQADHARLGEVPEVGLSGAGLGLGRGRRRPTIPVSAQTGGAQHRTLAGGGHVERDATAAAALPARGAERLLRVHPGVDHGAQPEAGRRRQRDLQRAGAGGRIDQGPQLQPAGPGGSGQHPGIEAGQRRSAPGDVPDHRRRIAGGHRHHQQPGRTVTDGQVGRVQPGLIEDRLLQGAVDLHGGGSSPLPGHHLRQHRERGQRCPPPHLPLRSGSSRSEPDRRRRRSARGWLPAPECGSDRG